MKHLQLATSSVDAHSSSTAHELIFPFQSVCLLVPLFVKRGRFGNSSSDRFGRRREVQACLTPLARVMVSVNVELENCAADP